MLLIVALSTLVVYKSTSCNYSCKLQLVRLIASPAVTDKQHTFGIEIERVQIENLKKSKVLREDRDIGTSQALYRPVEPQKDHLVDTHLQSECGLSLLLQL